MQADFNAHKFNVSRFNSDLLDIPLTETISISDLRTMDLIRLFTESQFLQDDGPANQISKGLSEEIRTAAWLSVKRKNPAQWSD